MDFGSDFGNLLLWAGVVLVIFLVLDLLVAGGGATGGAASCVGGAAGGLGGAMGSMMGGISSMMSTPWGWGLLLAIAAVAGAVLGGPGLLRGLGLPGPG